MISIPLFEARFYMRNAYEPQDRAHTWRMKNLTCFGGYVRSDMGSEGCSLFGTKILRLKLAITPRIRDCVTERACEIVPLQGYSHLPISGQ